MEVSRGSVYRRGETWTINYTVAGRRVREAIGPNKKLAEMVLSKRLTEAIENRWFDKRKVGVTPFSELTKIYIDRHLPMLKSGRGERTSVLVWMRVFGNRPIGQITRAELQDFQAWKRQKRKPATVNRLMSRLRHMFNKAIEWDLLDENPMKRLKFLPENNARLHYLSMDECQRLLNACKASHMRAMVVMALHTGMRRGEILNLTWQTVDFNTGSILVRESKNGQPRHIPMDSTVRHLLSGYIPTSAADHVFPRASGGRRSTVQKAFRNARRRAGMAHLHFHDLRHTFASHWVMSGGDLYVLKDILGHKSISMTQRYAHLSPTFKRTMVDRMERMWEQDRSAERSPQIEDRHENVTSALRMDAEIPLNPAPERV
jgi:integrase